MDTIGQCDERRGDEVNPTGCVCAETFLHRHLTDEYGWEVVVPLTSRQIVVTDFGFVH